MATWESRRGVDMLGQETLDIADRWWAQDFGCPPTELRPERTRVQPHAGNLVGSPRIWILVIGPAPLVSLPPAAVPTLAVPARAWTNALVGDATALTAAIHPLAVERIVGPAFIGYGTSKTLDLWIANQARVLTREDDPAVSRLRASCAPEEWEHGGSDPHAVPTFGCVSEGGEVLAMAGYQVWGGTIAHISVVTAPHARGRDFGRRAVACAAQHALSAGLLPQYRTLLANEPSMAVARRLGFVPYGYSVSIRLRGG
jgi:RimJ/RimL family protein N-acetyltransferase